MHFSRQTRDDNNNNIHLMQSRKNKTFIKLLYVQATAEIPRCVQKETHLQRGDVHTLARAMRQCGGCSINNILCLI